VLEAEQKADRLTRDAFDEVEVIRIERTSVMEEEVRLLAQQRDALETDIVSLHDFIDDQRRRLRGAVESLSPLVQDGGPLRMDDIPAMATPSEPVTETARAEAAEQRGSHISQLVEGPGDGDFEDATISASPDSSMSTMAESDSRLYDQDDDSTQSYDAIPMGRTSTDEDPSHMAAGSSPLGQTNADNEDALREFFEPDGDPPSGGMLRRR